MTSHDDMNVNEKKKIWAKLNIRFKQLAEMAQVYI